MLIEKPLFPTMFYETQIPRDLCFAVIEEIKNKQEMIDIVSESTQIQNINQYSTDFKHPIHIERFWNDVVPMLQNDWKKFNKQMIDIFSWVSCYIGQEANHPLHNHYTGYGKKIHYSGILYLSDVGVTDFLSIDATAILSQHQEHSQIGKVIYFPSIIPHYYRPDQLDGNTRYTLPFNFELVPCEN